MTPMSEETRRWSKATVHPDVRVDPQDDPRNSDVAEQAVVDAASAGLAREQAATEALLGS
jgi:hypothetical protein